MTIVAHKSASSRAWGVLVAASLVVSIAGCSSPATGVAPTTPVDIATSVPDGTDVEPTSDSEPCEALLNSADIAASLGKPNLTYVGTVDPLLALVGGLECEYVFITGDPDADDEDEDSYDTTLRDEVYLAVAPSSIATPAAVQNSLVAENCNPRLEERDGCTSTATVGDWWYSLSVSSATSAEVQKSSFEATTVSLEQALAAKATPPPVTGVTPFDCSSLTSSSAPVTSSRTLPPLWTGTEIFAAAFLLAGPVTCEFTIDKTQIWDLTVYPGGAAALAQCRYAATEYEPNSSLTDIENVETVYQLTNTGDEVKFCASDGKSLIRVYHEYSEDGSEFESDTDPEVDEAELLSTLLVPALAAASR
jgi:hypothetical protein